MCVCVFVCCYILLDKVKAAYGVIGGGHESIASQILKECELYGIKFQEKEEFNQ